MATAETDPEHDRRICPACGGRLAVLVRLKTNEELPPIAYFKCERCAHILIAEV